MSNARSSGSDGWVQVEVRQGFIKIMSAAQLIAEPADNRSCHLQFPDATSSDNGAVTWRQFEASIVLLSREPHSCEFEP